MVAQTAAAPDADGLRHLVMRVEAGRVRAVIESMNGARFVHDTLEELGCLRGSALRLRFESRHGTPSFRSASRSLDHRNNGEEERFPDLVGQFHKGLPHNRFGKVELGAYSAFIRALSTGESSDFERIPLGGTARLVNPQASLAFDTERVDSHQLTMPPAHTLDSPERAGEAVERWPATSRSPNMARNRSRRPPWPTSTA